MKKILSILCLLLFAVASEAQTFSSLATSGGSTTSTTTTTTQTQQTAFQPQTVFLAQSAPVLPAVPPLMSYGGCGVGSNFNFGHRFNSYNNFGNNAFIGQQFGRPRFGFQSAAVGGGFGGASIVQQNQRFGLLGRVRQQSQTVVNAGGGLGGNAIVANQTGGRRRR